jgi:predicted nucleotidyltransferase
MKGCLCGCLGLLAILGVVALGCFIVSNLPIHPVSGTVALVLYLLFLIVWIRATKKLSAKASDETPSGYPAISSDVWSRIQEELRRIELEEDVTILFACESGSRAWGFESDDSDYDVRFIYLRKTPWYLTIQNKRDVIERPISDELDIAGWDLPKALGLFRKSNPPLLEWLQSPIVYSENFSLRRKLLELLPGYYSPICCLHHYLHMAQKNFRKYLEDRDEVLLKKYFYVLRPVLACIWIERALGAVPMEFQILLDRIVAVPGLLTEINALLESKRAGVETGVGPRNAIISSFLETELARLEKAHPEPSDTRDSEKLDKLFCEMLVEVNGNRIA